MSPLVGEVPLTIRSIRGRSTYVRELGSRDAHPWVVSRRRAGLRDHRMPTSRLRGSELLRSTGPSTAEPLARIPDSRAAALDSPASMSWQRP